MVVGAAISLRVHQVHEWQVRADFFAVEPRRAAQKMRPWLLFIAAVRASEDCEVIDLPGSLKLDFSTSELRRPRCT